MEGSPRKMRSQSRTRSPDGARVVLSPLPTHVAYDLKYVDQWNRRVNYDLSVFQRSKIRRFHFIQKSKKKINLKVNSNSKAKTVFVGKII